MTLDQIRRHLLESSLLIVDGMLGNDGYVGNIIDEVDEVVVVLLVVEAKIEMIRLSPTQSMYGKK